MQIPLDEGAFGLWPQAPVNVKLFLQVSEERFQAIGGVRYLWIIQVVKHIGYRFNDSACGLTQHLMPVPIPASIGVECLLINTDLTSLVPVIDVGQPLIALFLSL